MKNVFNNFISRFDTALKRASKLENGDKLIEIVQREKQRGKIINETEHPKAVEKYQMI